MNFSNVTPLPDHNHQQGFGGSIVKINLVERTFLVLIDI